MFTLRSTLFAASVVALARAQSTPTVCDPTDPTTPPEVCSIRAAFGGSQVVPGIVQDFEPSGLLYVHTDNIIIGGSQNLSPTRVASPPAVQFNQTENLTSGPNCLSKYQTELLFGKDVFMMFDPDAGENASVLHYMLADCTVNEDTLYLEGCTAVAPYGGPAPPQGTGDHRYIQLLYTQPTGFQNPDYPATIGGTRLQWNFAEFVAGNDLGTPVGGMFFKSTYDGNSATATSTQDPNTVGGAAVTSAPTSVSSSARVGRSSAPISSAAVNAASGTSKVASQASSIVGRVSSSATPSVNPASSSGENLQVGGLFAASLAAILAIL